MSFSRTENFDQLFPDVRETGETQLRQCQLVMLRMLKIFDYLCRKHNIQYFLTGGTLLGAVRHKGFIPWDDDLDVGMKRKEYEKFIKLAAHELPNDVFFQTVDTDPYYPVHHQVEAKLRDKYSTYFRRAGKDAVYKFHNGIQLDIFVYDGAFLPSNTSLYYLNHIFVKYFRKHRYRNIRSTVLRAIEKFSPVRLAYASSYLNMRYMIKGGGCFKTAEELEQLISLPFEDMNVLAPQGYHNYLTRMYGDYMQLPPEEKRKGPHGVQIPDPFTPCDHTEILHWEHKKAKTAE